MEIFLLEKVFLRISLFFKIGTSAGGINPDSLPFIPNSHLTASLILHLDVQQARQIECNTLTSHSKLLLLCSDSLVFLKHTQHVPPPGPLPRLFLPSQPQCLLPCFSGFYLDITTSYKIVLTLHSPLTVTLLTLYPALFFSLHLALT